MTPYIRALARLLLEHVTRREHRNVLANLNRRPA